ncbi:helix-turn-helix domain-containing protein [Marinobacterium stanieri]|uniref:helix-turn-helix domain-containing protein n=1 Tax=Marinobacterium stanieri TaxID=49186 RepID=UPI00025588A7|nr:helix-turn-helix transcriptional regulator [Marinobacterium stanieri]
MKSFFESVQNKSHANQRLFAREQLIMNVTEDLLVELDKSGVTRKELARRLGKSKSAVSQMLDGNRNMTLGSLSDICFEVGLTPRVVVSTDANHHVFKKMDWHSMPNIVEFQRKPRAVTKTAINHSKWVSFGERVGETSDSNTRRWG